MNYERDLSHSHCYDKQVGHEKHLRCCICYKESDTHEASEKEASRAPMSIGTSSIPSPTDTSEGWENKLFSLMASLGDTTHYTEISELLRSEIDRARDEATMSVTYHAASYKKGAADTLERYRTWIRNHMSESSLLKNYNRGWNDALQSLKDEMI